MRHPHLIPPLVAIAHGSRDPRAGATVAELLAATRHRAGAIGLPGLDVRAAFLGHAPPSAMQVLTALAGERPPSRASTVVVLPLLLTAAYHSGTDIPGLLDEAQATLPALRIRYGEPLGPHPGLLRALERRLAEAGAAAAAAPGQTAAGQTAPEQTAVVLASAGSSDPAASTVIARMAADWQAARGWQAVLPAYASAASPTPAEAVARLLSSGARHVVVASYLLAPGLFADRIRASSLAAGAAVVSAPLGAAAEVAEVVLARYQRAVARAGAHEGGQQAGPGRAQRVTAR
jgi:sirohydrochlorin ferrochelatase